jgi:hypothetical protein
MASKTFEELLNKNMSADERQTFEKAKTMATGGQDAEKATSQPIVGKTQSNPTDLDKAKPNQVIGGQIAGIEKAEGNNYQATPATQGSSKTFTEIKDKPTTATTPTQTNNDKLTQ